MVRPSDGGQAEREETPMNASTKLIALRAATKVTLSVAVFGCGGTTLTEDGGLASTQPSDMDAAKSPPEPRKDASPGPCPGATSDAHGSVSADTFACCIAYLKTELVDADGSRLDAASAASKECCTSVVAFVDGDGGVSSFESAEPFLNSCCEALERPTGAACTPWGPPMPPAMTQYLEVA
jgi:hypothetical protein